MALLNRLFVPRKKLPKQNALPESKSEFYCSHNSWRPFDLTDKEFARVLLFRECDIRGCKLLFDSKTVQKVALSSEMLSAKAKRERLANGKKQREPIIEVNKDFGYQYLKVAPDAKMLGDLIFGSVAMSYKGTTLKVHTLKTPAQLMFSRIFPTPRAGRAVRISDQSLEDSIGSSLSSMNEYEISRVSTSESDIAPASSAHSGPMDVPGAELLNKQQKSEDSGFGGEPSLPSWMSTSTSSSSLGSYFPSFASSNGNSTSNPTSSSGSLNSLQRRWMRNKTTSFDFGSSGRQDSSVSSSLAETSSRGSNNCTHQPKSKLGLAIIINMEDLSEGEHRDFLSFTFTHVALLDSILNHLQEAVERAYLNKQCFVHSIVEAVEDLRRAVLDLYSAPRLLNPVWLGMISRTKRQPQLTTSFLTEFISLIEQYDTKNTNFFMSTLLTGVLTHHLAWVPTVTPSGNVPANCYHKRHTMESLDDLSRNHPYNPLWAQLGDLMGALGHPRKVSRTVLVGRAANLLDRFLWILTYFIRCNEVEEFLEIKAEKEKPTKSANCVCAPKSHCRSKSWGSCKVVEKPEFSSEVKVKKSPTFVRDLGQKTEKLYPSLEGLESEVLEDAASKVTKLCRVPQEALAYHLKVDSEGKNHKKSIYPSIDELKDEVDSAPKVVFLLGGDEKAPEKLQRKVNGISELSQVKIQFQKVPTNAANIQQLAVPPIKPRIEESRAVGASAPVWKNEPQVLTVHSSLVELEQERNGLLMRSQSDPEDQNNIKDANLYLKDYNSLRFGGNQRCTSMFEESFQELVLEEDQSDLGVQRPRNMSEPGRKPKKKSSEGGEKVLTESSSSYDAENVFSCYEYNCGSSKFINVPLPRTKESLLSLDSQRQQYGSTYLGASLDHYNSELVLHGCTSTVQSSMPWAQRLQKDLVLATQHSMLDEEVDGAVCIVGSTDSWEVQLVSSHTYIVDKPGTLGIQVGMSQLVANILESLLNLWKINVPPDFCLMYLEDRLQELYLRSEALAQYLLSGPFCNMDQVTSTFGLEANDIPLLMAVASVHTPKVTQMYGLSFR